MGSHEGAQSGPSVPGNRFTWIPQRCYVDVVLLQSYGGFLSLGFLAVDCEHATFTVYYYLCMLSRSVVSDSL